MLMRMTFIHESSGAKVRLRHENDRTTIDEAPDELRAALSRALAEPIYERGGALNGGALATVQAVLQSGTQGHFKALAHAPQLVDLGLHVVEEGD